jgi:hypothetical protein
VFSRLSWPPAHPSSVAGRHVPSSGLLTPFAPTLSTHPMSSPTVSEYLWAVETNESYESSVLRASPSIQLIALHELNTSFDTSFDRPSGLDLTSLDHPSPIPETPTTISSSMAISSSPFTSLPPVSSPLSLPSLPTMSPRLPPLLTMSSPPGLPPLPTMSSPTSLPTCRQFQLSALVADAALSIMPSNPQNFNVDNG